MLLPEAFRGDLDGETGGGILIESNMAARAAFSGDIGLSSGTVLVFRAGVSIIAFLTGGVESMPMILSFFTSFCGVDRSASLEVAKLLGGAACIGANSASESFGLSGSGTNAASTAEVSSGDGIYKTCSMLSTIMIFVTVRDGVGVGKHRAVKCVKTAESSTCKAVRLGSVEKQPNKSNTAREFHSRGSYT
jgi:hypothetical protein